MREDRKMKGWTFCSFALFVFFFSKLHSKIGHPWQFGRLMFMHNGHIADFHLVSLLSRVSAGVRKKIHEAKTKEMTPEYRYLTPYMHLCRYMCYPLPFVVVSYLCCWLAVASIETIERQQWGRVDPQRKAIELKTNLSHCKRNDVISRRKRVFKFLGLLVCPRL